MSENYIFESPDKGKTIYRRQFGNHTNCEIIKSKEDNPMTDEKWEAIQAHCRKISKEAIEWDKEEFKRWDISRNEFSGSKNPEGRCLYQLQP